MNYKIKAMFLLHTMKNKRKNPNIPCKKQDSLSLGDCVKPAQRVTATLNILHGMQRQFNLGRQHIQGMRWVIMLLYKLFLLFSLLISSLPFADANQATAQIHQLMAQHATQVNNTSSPVIQNLKANYEFVVFFRSTCPHCHRFIPILKDFAHYYGIKITAYSVDSQDLDDLHARKMTSNQYQDYYLQGGFKPAVPALFLQNKHTDQAYPVLFGEATPYQLAKRVHELMLHIQEREDEDH